MCCVSSRKNTIPRQGNQTTFVLIYICSVSQSPFLETAIIIIFVMIYLSTTRKYFSNKVKLTKDYLGFQY